MSATAGTIGKLGGAAPPRRNLRRAGAVLAGLLAIVVLSTAADAVMRAAGIFPPFPQRMADGLFLLATAYRIVFGVIGGYVAARLAPDHPLRHALALGGVGVVLSTAGAIALGEYGPAWYSIAIIAICVPCARAGARLAAARTR
jgi:hypothetical protein